nr:prepilin-type N-terminal cleavage/methylation domain-containing protein [Massilia sp. IC2-278]
MRQHGFSFMEVMVAVLVLAICAVPMMDALTNGLMVSAASVDKARELRCMKNTMEAILAEPYQTLWLAAAQDNAASYALPADAACAGVTRQLVISLCEQTGTNTVFLTSGSAQNRREAAMLHIALSSDKGYSFTTMVAR